MLHLKHHSYALYVGYIGTLIFISNCIILTEYIFFQLKSSFYHSIPEMQGVYIYVKRNELSKVVGHSTLQLYFGGR